MNAPTHIRYPTNVHALVPHLMNVYPEWTEVDIREFLEERIGRVGAETWQTVLSIYTGVVVRRQEFQGNADRPI